MLFLQFLYIQKEEEINDLKDVVSMLSCGALQRSSNTTNIIYRIDYVFLRIRKRYLLCWEENPEKG